MTSDADAAQRVASDPAVSAFVAASAGSGKTKLLTDRLLRLMLSDTDPSRIQCLTFTKAAAAEMAIRLQNRLSSWVTAPTDRLDADLRGFGLVPDAALLAKARKLFALVLDLPGGMRIGTIHAFCQSLLRRFPLEAKLSPHFGLLEDIDADITLRDSLESMLARAATPQGRAALETLAGLVSLDGFRALVARLESDRERIGDVLKLQPNGYLAALDRVTGARREASAVAVVSWRGEPAMRRAATTLAEQGSPSIIAVGEKMLDWLGLHEDDRVECWPQWRDIFLRPDGEARGLGALVNKKLLTTAPGLADLLAGEQARILAFEDGARAKTVSDLSAAVLRLAEPVVADYAARKNAREKLDFSDLIGRVNALLVDPGAAWVLYKLDGGLDHLLLDEVQDTSPAQWAIAGALTAEFFAGLGARDEKIHRTVFAVGDRKQSIYSFQGADPAAFEHWRRVLAQRVTDSGEHWRDVDLNVSFRSTQPVLALVDAVFDDPLAAAGVTEGTKLAHRAHRVGAAGCVELWPLAPRPEDIAPEPWQVPERNLGGASAPQRLADAIAEWIKGQTSGAVDLESQGRKLAPGDVLILVRRRNDFARALVRALKQRDVPVAGIDRMVLTAQPAVADLLALCDALLLPDDDLQFACLLTSPLGGLSDDSLMRLALGRAGSLRQALRDRSSERADWAAAEQFYAELLARVDYVTPHALLAEALGPLGGRARLLARLGPEASEPIDEFLNTALAYAQNHPPALQGFVHWLRQSGAEVKREAEAAGHVVRIMTVHGAKGLQAPLVILPDTTTIPRDDGTLLWAEDETTRTSLPLWSPRKEIRCAAAERLREAAQARQREEYNRLLYVALTRAEDRLVVCGWETHRAHPPECWYDMVRRGFSRLADVTTADFSAIADPWPGARLCHATAQTVAPATKPVPVRSEEHAPFPAWAGAAPAWRASPPPDDPPGALSLAPSRPENAGLGPVPGAASPLAARDTAGLRFRRGKLVHALLQHLPDISPEDRAAAADTYLRRPGTMLPAADIPALIAEILAVLDHPLLAPLFGPEGRAEVPLTGVVGQSVVGGLVDRLAVLPGRVLLADYKTNRAPPATVAAAPVLYLRQMAAYRAVLRGAFPGHAVACALVWTTGAAVMVLPDSLLDRHSPGVAIAA